jgi:hypothetical protein
MIAEFEQLVALVPPPEVPVHSGSMADFAAVEDKLDSRLPIDFKRLITTYGTGGWLEFYGIINPLDPCDAAEWFGQGRLQYLRDRRRDFPQYVPYPIWPDTGGLLPWGGHENGGDMYWLTEGDPDKWPTIFTHDRTPEYVRMDCTCTGFLLSAIKRTNPLVAEMPWTVRDNPRLFQSY